MKPHTKVYLCNHVDLRERPVLYVVREGADWQFLCGDLHDRDDCRVAGIGHLIEMDPTLKELSDLPSGFEANRSAVGDSWQISRIE